MLPETIVIGSASSRWRSTHQTWSLVEEFSANMEIFAVASWCLLVLLVVIPFFCEILGSVIHHLLVRTFSISLLKLQTTAAHLKREMTKVSVVVMSQVMGVVTFCLQLSAPADFVAKAKHERELISVEKQIELTTGEFWLLVYAASFMGLMMFV